MAPAINPLNRKEARIKPPNQIKMAGSSVPNLNLQTLYFLALAAEYEHIVHKCEAMLTMSMLDCELVIDRRPATYDHLSSRRRSAS
jgi:hypothetical protein